MNCAHGRGRDESDRHEGILSLLSNNDATVSAFCPGRRSSRIAVAKAERTVESESCFARNELNELFKEETERAIILMQNEGFLPAPAPKKPLQHYIDFCDVAELAWHALCLYVKPGFDCHLSLSLVYFIAVQHTIVSSRAALLSRSWLLSPSQWSFCLY